MRVKGKTYGQTSFVHSADSCPTAGICVANGSTEADIVEESNARYSRLLASKVSGDKFTDGEMQTLNPLRKTKEVQTNPFSSSSVASQACSLIQLLSTIACGCHDMSLAPARILNNLFRIQE